MSPAGREVLVAGVDGCRNGWVVATATFPAGAAQTRVVGSFAEVVDDVVGGRLACVAVDMPIGLPDAGPRACDVEARRRLGARRWSVFPAPVRPVLAASTWDDALATARATDGRGISLQTWHLVHKIREVDDALAPGVVDSVVEAHPELTLATMAGAPMAHPKRSRDGRAERLTVLRTALPFAADVLAAPLPGAALDDVVDAVALLWTAARHAAGRSTSVGDGTTDARGRPMRIVI